MPGLGELIVILLIVLVVFGANKLPGIGDALGRSLDYRDMPTVRRIVRQAAADDFRFKSIVLGVISSDAFRKRESEGGDRAPVKTASIRTGGL